MYKAQATLSTGLTVGTCVQVKASVAQLGPQRRELADDELALRQAKVRRGQGMLLRGSSVCCLCVEQGCRTKNSSIGKPLHH